MEEGCKGIYCRSLPASIALEIVEPTKILTTESGPILNCLDPPNIKYTIKGTKAVYNPYAGGNPASYGNKGVVDKGRKG